MKTARSSKSLDRSILSHIKDICTAIPAYVTEYDPGDKRNPPTISARIPFTDFVSILSGQSQPINSDWPEVSGVQVASFFQGGFSDSAPFKKGDIVLLMFVMRPIDEWLDSDGKSLVTPAEKDTHAESDCFVIAGLSTRKSKKPKTDGKRWIRAHEDGGLEEIMEVSGKKLHRVCDRFNIGSEDAGKALALAGKAKDNDQISVDKINELITVSTANGGIIPPGSVLPIASLSEPASEKAFTND